MTELSDYSSLEEEIKNVPEKKLLPAKTEAKFRIIKAEKGVVDNEEKKNFGMNYINITCDIPGHDAPMFNIFIWDLIQSNGWKDPNNYKDALRAFRDFTSCIGLDYTRPFDWETDVINREGWARFGIKKDKTGEHADKNQIMEYIIPK